MRMHKVTPEELKAMNSQTQRCAAELADARVDVISTACLVAIMAQGPGFHREVERDMAAAVAEAGATSKVMTSAGALIHGLKAHGCQKDFTDGTLHVAADTDGGRLHRTRRH
jgi:maleate isomerase